MQLLQRARRVLEPDLLRHHPGEVELALERPGGELREVLCRQVVAAVRDEDSQTLVEERLQLERCGRAQLREADRNERPGVAEQPQPLRQGLGPADDVEHEVEPLARAGVRGAEALRQLGLRRVQVDRVDLGGPGQPGALDGREADRAAADHRDARAFPDVRRVEDRAHAGGDAAGDQAGLLRRQVGVERDRRVAVDDCARGEGADPERLRELPTVGEGESRLGAPRRPAAARIAARAPAALAARRAPAEHDPVAGGHVLNVCPRFFHDPDTFVPEQNGQRMGPARLGDVEVRVADAARLEPDEHFVRADLSDLELLEAEAADLAQDDAAIHVESSSRALTPPISASVRSVSAASCSSAASTPSRPPTASAYAYGLPTRTASAPSARALSTSAPVRIPPSISTTRSPPTRSRTATSASSAPMPPSTCLPPWLETTTPSTPASNASAASSALRIPLTSSGRSVRSRSQARSAQVRARFGNIESNLPAATGGSSSGGPGSRERKTGSLVNWAMPSPSRNGRYAFRRSRGRQPSVSVSSVTTTAE